MQIKHSKFKNTGLLYELLVRAITSDVIEGNKTSPAINLLKKYFVNTELGKEHKLYEQLTKEVTLSEGKADMTISTLLEIARNLNRSTIRKQKYELVKEIKECYNESKFFQAKVKNYKVFAAFNILVESQHKKEVDPDILLTNKTTLLEHLSTEQPTVREKVLIEDYKKESKAVRKLAYELLLEKYNKKYENLTVDQKEILREFITSLNSPAALREYYNSKISSIKGTIQSLQEQVPDKVIKIKLTEVNKLIKVKENSEKVNSDCLVDLLHYYQLINEVNIVYGK